MWEKNKVEFVAMYCTIHCKKRLLLLHAVISFDRNMFIQPRLKLEMPGTEELKSVCGKLTEW